MFFLEKDLFDKHFVFHLFQFEVYRYVIDSVLIDWNIDYSHVVIELLFDEFLIIHHHN